MPAIRGLAPLQISIVLTFLVPFLSGCFEKTSTDSSSTKAGVLFEETWKDGTNSWIIAGSQSNVSCEEGLVGCHLELRPASQTIALRSINLSLPQVVVVSFWLRCNFDYNQGVLLPLFGFNGNASLQFEASPGVEPPGCLLKMSGPQYRWVPVPDYTGLENATWYRIDVRIDTSAFNYTLRLFDVEGQLLHETPSYQDTRPFTTLEGINLEASAGHPRSATSYWVGPIRVSDERAWTSAT